MALLSRRYAVGLIGLVILLAFTAFFFVPIAWLLIEPSKTTVLQYSNGQADLSQPPRLVSGGLSAWKSTFNAMLSFQGGILLVWMKNSAIYCFGGTALALALSVPAGYGLALTQFVGRRALLTVTLIVMIMPVSALALPLLLEANAIGLLNTTWSFMLPFALFPFGTYLAYIFFSSTIPKDLLAAARIDGAGEWKVFRHIALPLARPIVALVGFFALVADWNNFFLPFVMSVYGGPSELPLQVGLQQLVNQGGLSAPQSAMATLIAVAPVLIVFMFAQRMLVRGMLAGATKE